MLRKDKGRKSVLLADVPGKLSEVPADMSEVLGFQPGPSPSLAPAVGQRQSIGSPQSEEKSAKQIVPAHPSAWTMSLEEALKRIGIGVKCEPTTARWPFAMRPGRLGKRIQLVANRFSIDIPRGYIYHYSVAVKPNKLTSDARERRLRCLNTLNTRKNREVLEQAVKNAQANSKHLLYGVLPAYDGRKNLYTRKQLKLNAGETKEIPVELESEEYVIEIKPIAKKEQDAPYISLEPLHQLFEGRTLTFTEEILMAAIALQTILRHGPALKCVPISRSFYYRPREEELEPLGPGHEIWLGYHQKLQISRWKPMVAIDTSASVFYKSCPAMNLMMSILYPKVPEDRIGDELRQIEGLTENQRCTLLREMRNLVVEVVHVEYPRKYRIRDITCTAARNMYYSAEGKKVEITMVEYFCNNYHALKYPNLPCIVANTEKNILLPFELCKIASGQRYKKKLTDNETAKMIRQTCFVPESKFSKIRHGAEIIKRELERPIFGSQSLGNEFGICIDTSFTKLEGRVFDPPHLLYSLKQPILPVDGEWNMNDKHFFRCCEPVKRWIVINFSNVSEDEMKRFARHLISSGALSGIKFAVPIMSNFGQNSSPASCIEKVIQRYDGLQLAVIIVPPKRQNRTIYREIKISCETKFGLMTQCVVENNARRCEKYVLSNLCQKINAKLGGKNNSIDYASKPQMFLKPIIIIGGTCSHPSPGDTVGLSVAAIVGSLDSAPSKYKTSLRIQVPEKAKRKEIIQELKDMVKEVLLAFFQRTRCKPVKIVFYRNGVSEGDFGLVQQQEVGQIRVACRELEAEYKPGITFIVVGKRHHTRFMPEDRGDSRGKKGNVPPGTTVDTVVTHPLYSDYFMCSHLGIQGTSRPAHYTVLWDDNDFSADQLQQLTYFMCYTYTRCTRSISIPCPVMYAHLAAYRAKQYLVHLREERRKTGYAANANELQEMNDAIKVHKKIENQMYFT